MTYYCEYDDAAILLAATAKINELTFNRIVAVGFENLTELQRELVEMACRYQCEYYAKYGVDADGIDSISVEDFSVSYKSGSAASMGVDSRVLSCLKQTSLMCRRL